MILILILNSILILILILKIGFARSVPILLVITQNDSIAITMPILLVITQAPRAYSSYGADIKCPDIMCQKCCMSRNNVSYY